MVPSSSIAFTVDGERLTCSGFSLGKPIHLGNFEFIADYFGSLSLSPRRGNEGTIFVGSTHSGASTPQRAMIEDSTEDTHSIKQGRKLRAPFPQTAQHSGGGLICLSLQQHGRRALQPRWGFPRGRRHRGQRPTNPLSNVTLTAVQPDVSPWHEPTLEMERILMVDFTSTQA
jgi:hypothetical protein